MVIDFKWFKGLMKKKNKKFNNKVMSSDKYRQDKLSKQQSKKKK